MEYVKALLQLIGLGDWFTRMLDRRQARAAALIEQRAAAAEATVQAVKDLAAVAADGAGRSTDDLRARVLRDAAPDA